MCASVCFLDINHANTLPFKNTVQQVNIIVTKKFHNHLPTTMDICLLGPSPGIRIPSYLGNFPVDTSWREEEPVCPIEAECEWPRTSISLFMVATVEVLSPVSRPKVSKTQELSQFLVLTFSISPQPQFTLAYSISAFFFLCHYKSYNSNRSLHF